MFKAPDEKPGVLDRGQWSRLAGTGCKTGTYGRFRPVLMGCFLVVELHSDSGAVWFEDANGIGNGNRKHCNRRQLNDYLLCLASLPSWNRKEKQASQSQKKKKDKPLSRCIWHPLHPT